MTVPVRAAAVANEFLNLQNRIPGANPIDNMKMQKLLFYAHAWFLAINDKPLIEEPIEAWSWGPVVRSVYLDFKHFGRNQIEGHRATAITVTDNGHVKVKSEKPELKDTELKHFVQKVWEVHKDFTGIQLSNSTHGEGEPWSEIKNYYGDLRNKPTIPNDLIKSAFKAKLT